VDLGAAITRLMDEGLIERGGGHRTAAGLTLARGKVPAAMERLAALVERQRAEPPAALRIDGALAVAAATADLCATLEAAGPFGAASPAPRVVLPRVRIAHARPVGDGHLQLGLAGECGGRLPAIAFRCAGTALGQALAAGQGGTPFRLAGRLELDTWGGRRRAKFCVEDAAAG
jgi:single-stranded-DNA-specific exonuclease